MGYRGKVAERAQARKLRAQGHTLEGIARQLGVAKSSVSLWVRDIDFTPRPVQPGQRRQSVARKRPPSKPQQRKAAEILELKEAGRARIGKLSDRDLLIAGTALYAGEGAKRDGEVMFANTNPEMMRLFCVWLRRFFDVDETRLRVRLYLHQGLDLETAEQFWAELTGIPLHQFRKPYRAVPDTGIRTTKHPYGCASVKYSCSRTHREIMGLVDALLCWDGIPG